MIETELNSNDKLRLKADIKISMIIGFLFSIALIIFVLVIPALMFIFGNRPSDGFVTRSLSIIGILFIPFLAISWTNILKYIDLSRGKKLIYKSDNFEVINRKNTAYIMTFGHHKQKIEIDIELVPFIESSQPLTIEISNLAKSVLFISHDCDNLLDKIYDNELN